MDYKNSKAPVTTPTRDMTQITDKVDNTYEAVVILGKRANQISSSVKKELDAKLQDFSTPQDNLDETFENREQIEISRKYERMPKPTLIATQEFLDGELIYQVGSKDEQLKD